MNVGTEDLVHYSDASTGSDYESSAAQTSTDDLHPVVDASVNAVVEMKDGEIDEQKSIHAGLTDTLHTHLYKECFLVDSCTSTTPFASNDLPEIEN